MNSCIFCEIAAGKAAASIVHEDTLTLAFIDERQFHAGHTLVIPRAHLHDVRELDAISGAALMSTIVRVTRAVSAAFPSDGLSLWHSIGSGAYQEVPHLHMHIHPRTAGDELLRVYPRRPASPERRMLDEYAAAIRRCMHE